MNPGSDSVIGQPDVSGTILLCDDCEPVRTTTMRILKSQGYEVLAADSPARALELLDGTRTSIELLISDVVMPGLTGPQLAAQVVARVPGVRVLYASGYSVEEVAGYGVEVPDENFLEKPFTARELLQRVQVILTDRDTVEEGS